MFNTLCVLGATSLVVPITVPESTVRIDAAIMMGVSGLAWVMVLTRKRISRVEGAVLLMAYVGYVSYVVLSSRSGAAV